MTSSNVKVLRLPAVALKTGLSRSTIYDWMNPKSPRFDSTFPRPRSLGSQSVGWLEAELDEWILQRIHSVP
ncbi:MULTISPECIES: AlpA family transcriptional regulator [Yersiniaceae]|jgi:prophage regulatory protein|uniref:AlpA family transcriptional regulator n=1 Tax=Yersiniaceae TaxID=1903411 RepID=UPI000B70675C|nr:MULTISPECIES: AlpA family transcriptional regulator [Yersiniaceae]MBW5813341.1 AlpA family transcriptional regulator [Yersinia kristensenii]MBW5830652.1 AlpA family transcriptional regulator [Yersinia kristensenii]MBW5867540.1 AlpA family transcriptional regulator [Yersinia enterocolitica]MCB5298070.1 AlpA family transcriptional regulator [Yersinia intermedia]MCW8111074.1 AlpA family transcriptional regulator [Yersinia intermedia]